MYISDTVSNLSWNNITWKSLINAIPLKIQTGANKDEPLLDGDGNTQIDQTLITKACVETDNEMVLYVPHDETNAGLVFLAGDIARYHLYRMSEAQDAPKADEDRYHAAIKILEKMASGDMPIDSSDNQAVTETAPRTPDARVVSVMDNPFTPGFWD